MFRPVTTVASWVRLSAQSEEDPVSASETAPVLALDSDEPRVVDTYALTYALILLFLLPGVALMSKLPFGDSRSSTYTLSYVSLVTVPFLLGVAGTLILTTSEGLKKALVRIAVLTPLIVMTGVTLMFGYSIVMVLFSKTAGIAQQGLSASWWAGLAVVAAPLVVSLVRRIRTVRSTGASGLFQIAAILAVLALVVGLVVFSFGVDANVYEVWRKDVVIYVVGALTWYAPSFGLATGFWRRTGLV